MNLTPLMLGLCLIASTARADDFKLIELGSARVDYLTFGLTALENDLRLRQLELCSKADCRGVEVEHRVSFVDGRPSNYPATLSWPEGGAIVIRVSEKRTGPDSSFATESGCGTRLNTLRISSKFLTASSTSYARFFLSYADWQSVRDIRENSPAATRMRQTIARMFLVVTESHEFNKQSGEIDRGIWVSCFGTMTGNDAVVIGSGQWPK